MTPAWIARESFIGALVGDVVDSLEIPKAPRVPDEAIDFTRFHEGEDEGE